ncbi:helix-turn-helix transcriptional regulator [Candidatus Chloroploca sp. M-50]|uniref:Helix-turn-helix transcriptional regulator n=1 Tax=Candidatus Chloroploca mongolica TaxID=2528176 RepID=A0ABS4DFQ9_9CHLR|nr:helix-turn-helix transcriptional regulator [Candidatus Chloroploca mongolica]MBP1468268.1 helix-turn-helix transcriptional regulator [Candidatus Chloroploca mongolica]
MTSQRDNLLTTREHDVMTLVASGASDRQIALQLFLSPWTVRHYVRHVCVKLGAPNRTAAAVRYAVRYWPHVGDDTGQKQTTLSPQEHRVLDLVVEGLRDDAIATHLDVSISTVRQHILRACHKLGVEHRTGAAVAYYRRKEA